MNDLDAIAQLVFFVLIVAGWVIKAVVEARQAKRRKGAAPPPAPESEVAEEPSDRVVRPRPRPVPPSTVAQSRSTRLSGEERLGHLDVALAERHLAGAGGTAPGRLLRSSAAAVAHGKAAQHVRRASILRRLSGGVTGRPGPDLTRAGVLWSEILGPCRALAGPHRSPAAARRRGS